jgi:hypothetical protein
MHREAAGEWSAAAGALRLAARHAKSNGALDEAEALLEDAHRLEGKPENEPARRGGAGTENGANEAGEGMSGQGRRLQIVSGKA